MGSTAAFFLSIYTIYGVFSSAIEDEGLIFEMDVDQTTGVGTLEVQLEPSNPSYLDANFSLDLSLMDSKGESVAHNSGSILLPPGASVPLHLILEVASEDIERIALEGDSSLKIHLSLRTFYGLVSISDTFTITQGKP